ncbi:hypothetical protein EYF80_004796 [Liparis tanakae]|uniref:Uncharacterized protein n=1 Tax=Liparis tanakae TaxID=230148 RepID=A0A4Z2J479_9TELE|nr:hypothetical protein EYF80_004796 [Liparis tanakae]
MDENITVIKPDMCCSLSSDKKLFIRSAWWLSENISERWEADVSPSTPTPLHGCLEDVSAHICAPADDLK